MKRFWLAMAVVGLFVAALVWMPKFRQRSRQSELCKISMMAYSWDAFASRNKGRFPNGIEELSNAGIIKITSNGMVSVLADTAPHVNPYFSPTMTFMAAEIRTGWGGTRLGNGAFFESVRLPNETTTHALMLTNTLVNAYGTGNRE